MRNLRRILGAGLVAAGAALTGGAAQAAKYKVVLNFGTHKLGSNPEGPVLIDPQGDLFTTASQGSGHNDGTVIELTPRSGKGGYKATTIFRFGSRTSSGAHPSGPLIIDTRGNLYGIAGNLVYEISPAGKQSGARRFFINFARSRIARMAPFPWGA